MIDERVDDNVTLSKWVTADQAASLIADDSTVAICGAGGGLLEPDELLAGIERRFLSEHKPQRLTIIHSQGLGDKSTKGLNRLAHVGLVKRVIGAHWAWSPRMQQLALDEQIEAYALPGGVIQHLVREIAAGRPGLITSVGLQTMVDPRFGGGRMNASAIRALSELVVIDGREYVRYFPFKIDAAIIRGTRADSRGNVSFDEEGAELDALVLAMAAHNCGGRVLIQVKERVPNGEQRARSVRLPAALVNVLTLAPAQLQSHDGDLGSAVTGNRSGRNGGPTESSSPRDWSIERLIIATRARAETANGKIVSVGLGMPDGVLTLRDRDKDVMTCYQTLDHGHYGGSPAGGSLFGFVYNGEALIDSPSQFDFYSGGGIDIAYLGFGEVDRLGNVNVSRIGGRIVGPGGFIDISQSAKKVVFCGTFETKGLRLGLIDGRVAIESAGSVAKLVKSVEEITFSGLRALAVGQEVIYVTERAVFRLTKDGIELEEILPGIDLQSQVLDRMEFTPIIRRAGPTVMNANAYFSLLSPLAGGRSN